MALAEKAKSSVCGLRSLQIGVVDRDHMVDFFTRAWGLSLIETGRDAAFLRATGADNHVIGLHQRPKTEVLRMDWRAPSRADVDAIHQRLAASGADGLTRPMDVSEPGGGYGFKVRDPDDRLLLVLTDDARHDEAIATKGLPRKLSHVVLNTSDAPALEAFYIDQLGFRLVDRTRRMAFINCNADHHSVAIVPSKHKTLHHVAFEMADFDALMRGIGRLRAFGIDVGWGVGRHGPGDNIFVYFAAPENLPLEFTTEVQQIDETYRPGEPDDWKPVPGRMDQWGATGAPSPAMAVAEESIGFSRESL